MRPRRASSSSELLNTLFACPNSAAARARPAATSAVAPVASLNAAARTFVLARRPEYGGRGFRGLSFVTSFRRGLMAEGWVCLAAQVVWVLPANHQKTLARHGSSRTRRRGLKAHVRSFRQRAVIVDQDCRGRRPVSGHAAEGGSSGARHVRARLCFESQSFTTPETLCSAFRLQVAIPQSSDCHVRSSKGARQVPRTIPHSREQACRPSLEGYPFGGRSPTVFGVTSLLVATAHWQSWKPRPGGEPA